MVLKNARVEDIAAKPAKPVALFYANFQRQEDVFFAIFEEELDHDIRELRQSTAGLDLEERLHALAQYLE